MADSVRRVSEQLGIKVRVVLVPRHPERSGTIADGLRDEGLTSVLWSQQDVQSPAPLEDDDLVEWLRTQV